MKVQTRIIQRFEDLHAACVDYRQDKNWVFRGQSDAKWKVRPKVGRGAFARCNEAHHFGCWKRGALGNLDQRPESEWEWLAIARHHGFATRLLDWTLVPLNAAFFAVQSEGNADGVIYAAKFLETIIP